MNADRQYAVASLLFDYVKSPSLRHLRDPHSVHKLARDIVSALDRASSIWSKWESEREEVAKACCMLDSDGRSLRLSKQFARSVADQDRRRTAFARNLGRALHELSQ